MDEEKTRAVAKRLGWTITRGSMGPCENCAKGKAKSKAISLAQGPKEKESKVNGRVYLDISTIRNPAKKGTQPTKPRWHWMCHGTPGTIMTYVSREISCLIDSYLTTQNKCHFTVSSVSFLLTIYFLHSKIKAPFPDFATGIQRMTHFILLYALYPYLKMYRRAGYKIPSQ
jgi:hypothetical protein